MQAASMICTCSVWSVCSLVGKSQEQKGTQQIPLYFLFCEELGPHTETRQAESHAGSLLHLQAPQVQIPRVWEGAGMSNDVDIPTAGNAWQG